MLMGFDPFREFDRLMRRPVGSMGQAGLAMDAYRRGDDSIVEIDLPGVDADSIDLTVERDVLEVSAERTAGYREGDELLVGERDHGKVVRQLFLCHALDETNIHASYDAGVLTITIPVAETARSHRVAINAGRQQAVEAGGSAWAARPGTGYRLGRRRICTWRPAPGHETGRPAGCGSAGRPPAALTSPFQGGEAG